MIVVERAPPYLTVQDMGRPGYRASGVPTGGAMDQWALATANLLIGNERGAAALEWAIAGGSLRFERDCVIAMAGTDIEATLDGVPVTAGQRLSVRSGQVLAIRRLVTRRFLYLAVSGGIDCPAVLGSRSTYLPASLGGIEGRRLIKGDRLPTGQRHLSGENADVVFEANTVGPDYDAREIRVVAAANQNSAGPDEAQGGLFKDFFETSYTVSPASDRMGYRLVPDRSLGAMGASITSEPVCSGAIQLPPNGEPIVLMADSPTVGGYTILGTVISCDLPILAQCMPGRKIRFAGVSVDAAQEALRERTILFAELATKRAR